MKNINRLQQSNRDAGQRGKYHRAQMKDGICRRDAAVEPGTRSPRHSHKTQL